MEQQLLWVEMTLSDLVHSRNSWRVDDRSADHAWRVPGHQVDGSSGEQSWRRNEDEAGEAAGCVGGEGAVEEGRLGGEGRGTLTFVWR